MPSTLASRGDKVYSQEIDFDEIAIRVIIEPKDGPEIDLQVMEEFISLIGGMKGESELSSSH